MTISSLTGQSYATQVSTQRIAALKSQFDGLTTQLATGRVSETYGGLGGGRSSALSAQARIAALDGYAGGITSARTKLSLASSSVTQLQTIAAKTSSTLNAGVTGKTQTGLSTQQTNARQQLAAMLDALNQTTGESYVFAGRATDTQPAAGADLILDGDKGAKLDGLTTLIAERKTADGVGGTGNLAVGSTGSTVTLSEPGDALTRANFGFILGGITSTGTALTTATTPSAAAATSVTLAALPKDGDVIRVTLDQPDGSQKLVDYVARTTPTPGSTTEFAIGAGKADSQGNLNALIGGAVVAAAQSGNPAPGADVAVDAANPGTAGSVDLTVGTPADGDSVTVSLTLRDGTTASLTLTAKASPDASDPTQFKIGLTPAATAASLRTALTSTLQTAAGTTLASTSATLAAKDMFAGSTAPGLSPRRIDTAAASPRFAANPAGTVIWYKGDDAPGDARATASAQVGDGYSVPYGARANEAAIQSALAGLGALATESFTVGASGALGTGDATRYAALQTRVTRLLAPSDGVQTLTQIGTDLSLADTAMASAQTRNTATKSVLENTVSGIEDATTESVATQLLALQNQLQASYQVTSMISKLSLVNYL